MNACADSLKIATKGMANVLITGPTGSGKTCLARKIHEGSARRAKPFVTVNLATLHDGTLESELFGHERGAFTGADQRRMGRLELAQGGTVFLDEVGDLSLRLQARLLEFLQSRIITPVGSNREIRLDVRVIAATHRDLPRAIARGEFREDLFHRLRVISIPLRSLTERNDEFDQLVHATLAELCAQNPRSILRISEQVAARFETYSWPGNLRELRNVLEYAVLAADGEEILSEHLPQWFLDDEKQRKLGSFSSEDISDLERFFVGLDYQAAISGFEKSYLERALLRNRGRINHTARTIGMNKTTLLRRMKAYGLNVDEIHSSLAC
jgi:DNA-binding NtrC family response regulator